MTNTQKNFQLLVPLNRLEVLTQSLHGFKYKIRKKMENKSPRREFSPSQRKRKAEILFLRYFIYYTQ